MNNQILVEPIVRIDYYSVMLDNCTIGSILEKFGYNLRNQGSDLLCCLKDDDKGYEKIVMYRTDFFRVIVNLAYHRRSAVEVTTSSENWDEDQVFDFFQEKYIRVKVEAAGAELNNMRKAGYCPEEMFTDPCFWIAGEHPIASDSKVTRCDFAYDFIDHPSCPDLPCRLCKALALMQTNGKLRLSTSNNRPGGLSFKNAFSDRQTCCYFGSQTSNEFLRVYDKLQEQAEKVYHRVYDSNMWPEDAEFRGCKSWTRIELQCRGEKAARRLYQNGTALQIMRSNLKYVFENYLVCAEKNKPFEFLKDYYDYSVIDNIDFV